MAIRRTISIVLLVSCIFVLTGCQPENESGWDNPFFAMDTGTKDANHQTAKAQAEMLSELGYDGIGYEDPVGVAEMLEELSKNNLKMHTIYMGAWSDRTQEEVRYHPKLPEAIKQLKGTDTIIWLRVAAKNYEFSSPDGDPCAIRLINEIADMAAESGLKVALYPHVGGWLERPEDGVRLARKVNRDNVGTTFNLYHWLKLKDRGNLESILKDAMPYLIVVTINGSSGNYGLRTLDDSNFDIYSLLKILKDLGYTGPVGLQGYKIKGDVHENLKRSMNAWQNLTERLKAGPSISLSGKGASLWRGDAKGWEIVGNTLLDPANGKLLAAEPGIAVIVNGPKGNEPALLSKAEFGDVRAHIEFMVSKGSNSGIYFMGRYEVQILDSWGVKAPKFSDCGGIYQRWDENKNPKGYEGHSPRVNASLAPGKWQSFDIIFRTPKFDSNGQKISNAMFEKVIHNGIVIHENVPLTGPTRAGYYNDEKAAGPLMLQGDHGPVAYRNIWVESLD